MIALTCLAVKSFKSLTQGVRRKGGLTRTAVTICGIFLARNGKTLTAKPKYLEDYTIRIAVEHLTIVEISSWLKVNT
jgi:prophage maintenance system killer protein